MVKQQILNLKICRFKSYFGIQIIMPISLAAELLTLHQKAQVRILDRHPTYIKISETNKIVLAFLLTLHIYIYYSMNGREYLYDFRY